MCGQLEKIKTGGKLLATGQVRSYHNGLDIDIDSSFLPSPPRIIEMTVCTDVSYTSQLSDDKIQEHREPKRLKSVRRAKRIHALNLYMYSYVSLRQ